MSPRLTQPEPSGSARASAVPGQVARRDPRTQRLGRQGRHPDPSLPRLSERGPRGAGEGGKGGQRPGAGQGRARGYPPVGGTQAQEPGAPSSPKPAAFLLVLLRPRRPPSPQKERMSRLRRPRAPGWRLTGASEAARLLAGKPKLKHPIPKKRAASPAGPGDEVGPEAPRAGQGAEDVKGTWGRRAASCPIPAGKRDHVRGRTPPAGRAAQPREKLGDSGEEQLRLGPCLGPCLGGPARCPQGLSVCPDQGSGGPPAASRRRSWSPASLPACSRSREGVSGRPGLQPGVSDSAWAPGSPGPSWPVALL